MVAELGWKTALDRYLGIDGKEAFYLAFEFLTRARHPARGAGGLRRTGPIAGPRPIGLPAGHRRGDDETRTGDSVVPARDGGCARAAKRLFWAILLGFRNLHPVGQSQRTSDTPLLSSGYRRPLQMKTSPALPIAFLLSGFATTAVLSSAPDGPTPRTAVDVVDVAETSKTTPESPSSTTTGPVSTWCPIASS